MVKEAGVSWCEEPQRRHALTITTRDFRALQWVISNDLKFVIKVVT